jgi:hypothetical protein
MLSAIKNFINEKIFGTLDHRYEPIEVQHGQINCQDKFEIRIKKDRCRLFHERVWSDNHDVKKYFEDYGLSDIEKLVSVFQNAQRLIERGESKDFGVILDRSDGNMKSSTRFYLESSGGNLYLFSREDSQMSAITTDGLESSEHAEITYYPIEEVAAVETVLADAMKRFSHFEPEMNS